MLTIRRSDGQRAVVTPDELARHAAGEDVDLWSTGRELLPPVDLRKAYLAEARVALRSLLETHGTAPSLSESARAGTAQALRRLAVALGRAARMPNDWAWDDMTDAARDAWCERERAASDALALALAEALGVRP